MPQAEQTPASTNRAVAAVQGTCLAKKVHALMLEWYFVLLGVLRRGVHTALATRSKRIMVIIIP